MSNLFYKRTRVEQERANRIKLCIYAYTYELLDHPVASDAEFDELVRKIDLSIKAGLDDWWEKNFIIDTGRWIHTHPDLEGIARLVKFYER